MDILFLHNNFPGQFVHLSQALARQKGVRILAVGGPSARLMPHMALARYGKPADAGASHPLAGRFLADVTRGELAANAMEKLKRDVGCDPALVIGHSGWGETLFARDVFPRAKHLTFCEFYYNAHGADVGFDPEFGAPSAATAYRTRAKNAAMLLSLATSDHAVSPTEWQRSQHPESVRSKIEVIHDGIDTIAARPDDAATFTIPGTNVTLSARDEVITFVSRQLEPYRGYHIFMRALPEILERRPGAQVLIVGGDGVSYGRAAPHGKKWKNIFLDEVRDQIDMSRVYFLGHIAKASLIRAFQVSSCHVYLTYPFVLSWSLMEAMAAGCSIVASDTPPVREVVTHDETGALFDFFDARALAETVVEAVANRAALADRRSRARAHIVDKYDLYTKTLPKQSQLASFLVTRL